MTILSKLKSLLGSGTATAVVAAATPIATNALDQAVIVAKSTEIGAAAIAAVKAAEVPGETGAAKKATAIAAVVPVVVLHVSKVGLAATMADLETFAGLVIESVLADLKATGPMAIAEAALKIAASAATAAA